jgi:flagellar biosynthetic protein FliR
MNFAELLDPIFTIFLVVCRVGALWIFFPIFGSLSVPPQVRVAGALVLSVALAPLVGPFLPAWSIAKLPGTLELVSFVVREFLVGALMGLVARWMFSVAIASAHWVGMQMGFAMGDMFNPETGANESAWAEMHNWIAMVLFLGIGGHYLLIQALRDSYALDPSLFLTRIMDPGLAPQFWTEVGSQFFIWMIRLAGPMVVVLFLLQAGLGVLSKFIPQINIWIVSIPITIGLGVFAFSLLSPMYGDALGQLFEAQQGSSRMVLKFLGGR